MVEAAGGLFVVDTSTCSRGVATNLFVRSQRSTTIHDGTTTEGGGTHLRMDVYDGCLGGFTASYDATTDIQSLQIDPNLGFASLHVTVPARDIITGAVVDITLDLVWTAVDNPYHDVLSGVEHFDSATSVGHTRTMIRRALTAGTLTIGGVTVSLELEDYGDIQRVVTSNKEVARQNH